MALKLADFGLSDLQTLPGGLSGTRCGSPLYAAPELMTDGRCAAEANTEANALASHPRPRPDHAHARTR
eukprot:3218151-Prymnesium_polylepis.1